MTAELPKRFTNPDAARKHLESLLWPDGPHCPHCGVVNEATALKGKSTRAGVYWCNACQKPFSVTVGTVYERSKVPLHVWLYATHLMASSKKGISSHQLARMLGVTYKTAWFMSHRIREAMTPADESQLGGSGQIVESDEAELGPSKHTRPRGHGNNLKFVTLIERGGRVRSRKLLTGKGESIGAQVHGIIWQNVARESTLHSDGATHYKSAWPIVQREAVNHNKQFVRMTEAGQKVHVNSAEGFFSIFKRGLVGTYQHMSAQHLERYLAEFDFRMSYRIKLGYDDAMRADKALEGIVGKRLTYRRTHEAQDA